MRKWVRWWPLVAVLPLIFPLNVDYVVIPMLQESSLPGPAQFLISVLLAISELVCWYFFWGWMRDRIHKALDSDIENVKEAGEQTGFLNFLKFYFYGKYYKYTDINSRQVKTILHGGRLLVFLLAALVPTGTRIIATIICGAFRARRTFLWVCLGDIVHTTLFFFGWKGLLAVWHSFWL